MPMARLKTKTFNSPSIQTAGYAKALPSPAPLVKSISLAPTTIPSSSPVPRIQDATASTSQKPQLLGGATDIDDGNDSLSVPSLPMARLNGRRHLRSGNKRDIQINITIWVPTTIPTSSPVPSPNQKISSRTASTSMPPPATSSAAPPILTIPKLADDPFRQRMPTSASPSPSPSTSPMPMARLKPRRSTHRPARRQLPNPGLRSLRCRKDKTPRPPSPTPSLTSTAAPPLRQPRKSPSPVPTTSRPRRRFHHPIRRSARERHQHRCRLQQPRRRHRY